MIYGLRYCQSVFIILIKFNQISILSERKLHHLTFPPLTLYLEDYSLTVHVKYKLHIKLLYSIYIYGTNK